MQAAHEANELLVALPPGWQAKARPGDLLMALAAQVGPHRAVNVFSLQA